MFLNSIKQKSRQPIFWISFSVFIAFFLQNLLMHIGFKTSFFDLYFFDQATWSLSQGNGTYLSIRDQPFFADHLYLYLIPISWLYKIYPSVMWLFFVQASLLVLTVIPILKLSKHYFGDKGFWLAFVACLAYLPFRQANLTSLHGEVVLMPIFAWISYFVLLEKYRWVFYLALLIPFTKEISIVYSLGVACLLAVKKQFRYASLFFSYAVAFFLISVLFLKPALGSIDAPSYLDRFSYLNVDLTGSNPYFALIKAVVFQPVLVIKHVISPAHAWYVFSLFLPVAFLAFFSPIMWLSLGTLGLNLLSDSSRHMLNVKSHHSILMASLVFFAALDVLNRTYFRKKLATRGLLFHVVKGCFVFSVTLNILVFVFTEMRAFFPRPYYVSAHKGIKQVPKTASVAVSDYFSPHLCYRNNLFLLDSYTKADYVLLDKGDPYFPENMKPEPFIEAQWQQKQYAAVIKGLFFGEKRSYKKKRRYKKQKDKVLTDSDYRKIDEGLFYILLKKNKLKTL